MGSVPRPAVGVVSARLASEFRDGPCCASGARDESRRVMTRDDASEEPAWNLVESSRASSIQVRGREGVRTEAEFSRRPWAMFSSKCASDVSGEQLLGADLVSTGCCRCSAL
jgi:hypothetical protein